MRHPNWRMAGAAGLAAGLTVGGFSLVSASSLERAVQTVEVRESKAAPAADSAFRLVAVATAAPEGSLYTASPDKHTAAPSLVVTAEHAASPKLAPKVIPTVATNHVDSVDSVASVASVDSANSVDSVASVASVDSANSVDSDD